MTGLRDAVAAAVSMALFLASGTSGAARRPATTLVVRVSNEAGTDGASLAKAQAQANRIFEDVGVRIVWSDVGVGPYDPGCQLFSVFVALLPVEIAGPASSQGLGENVVVLGSAQRASGRAFIYPRRISVLAARTQLSFGDLLGRVIAHEIGHLLLAPGHSQRGIMTAALETDPARTSARFVEAESRAIRTLLGSGARSLQGQATCGS